MGALALSAPARAACEAPSSAEDLSAAISAAEDAFARMDEAAFSSASAEVDARLACAGEPLSRKEAAALHQLVGLERFFAHDREAAAAAFSAARAADPKAELPDSVAPPGHPLRALSSAPPTDPARVEVGPPPAGYLVIDGRRGTARPTTLPTVLQGVAPNGELWVSAYLWPQDPLPPWPDTLLPTPSAHPHARRNVAIVLGSLAVGSAAASVGLYSAAHSAEAQYWALSTPSADLPALRSKTNTTQTLAFGAGGLALGIGAAATWVAFGGSR